MYTKWLLECLQCFKSLAILSNKTQAKSQCCFSLLLAGIEEPNQIKHKEHLSLYSLEKSTWIYTEYIIYTSICYKIVLSPCSSSPLKSAPNTDIRSVVLQLFIHITVPILLLQSVILSTLASTPHEAGTRVRRCGTLRDCCLTAPGSSSGRHQDWSRGRHRRPGAAASHKWCRWLESLWVLFS